MLRADQAFVHAVDQAVGALEHHTDAEVVVVVAARSSRWLVRRLTLASGLAFAVLAFAVYGPTEVPALWLPVDLALVYALAAWLPGRLPGLLSPLLGAGERARVAERAAHAAFFEEEVHSTRRRTGVLVYVSLLERQVLVIPDSGVSEHVPPGALERAWRLGDQQGFVDDLEALGHVLGKHLPSTDDNPDELPNRPRIRA